MKLNSKLCSPFFLLLLLAVCFSCMQEHKRNTNIHSKNVQVRKKLGRELDIADSCYNNKDYYTAYTHYVHLKEKYKEIKDYDNIGYVCLKMAGISYEKGNYTESQTTAVEALDYLKKSGKVENLASLYNQLGVTYRKLYNNDFAISSYEDAIKYTNTKDSLPIYTIRNNIASIYIDEKQYYNALGLLLPINNSDSVNTKPYMKARVLDNLGAVYFRLNNPLKALPLLERALQIRETINDKKGLISSCFNLSYFYSHSNNVLAKKYALKAYNAAKEIDNKEEELKALKFLSNTTVGQERDKYISSFMILNDAVTKNRIIDENKFAKIKYDYRNTQAENLKLQAQQATNALKAQQDRFVKWVLTGVSLAIVMIFVFIYKTQKIKHKKDKIIEVYNTERRISKKVHDELANDVFKAMSFAESDEVQYPGKEKLLEDLDAIYTKTRDISHENSTIDTGENFGRMFQQMLMDYKTTRVNVLTANFETVDWNPIAGHKKIEVYRVLHELMVNMKKHSGASLVVVRFSIENKKMIIDYKDNGRGISTDKIILKNGLQNAENRIKTIDGFLTFETSTNGLKVNCTFPV